MDQTQFPTPDSPSALRENYEYCVAVRQGHLLEVTINRPEVRNSIHPMVNDELTEIFDVFEADSTLWVAIITGAGTDAFSQGVDLKYFFANKVSPKSATFPGSSGLAGLTQRIRTKPVIAAVNGYAVGGGMEICLACDIIVADEKTQFGLPEVRVGVAAGGGGIIRLPRQIPKKIATELLLTGRMMPVDEAYRLGLINRIVSAGKALDGAREIAAQILEAAPLSVKINMEIMNEASKHSSELDDALLTESSRLLDALLASEDAREGPRAFAEKRQPNWKNR